MLAAMTGPITVSSAAALLGSSAHTASLGGVLLLGGLGLIVGAALAYSFS